jgi:hypothetical protein
MVVKVGVALDVTVTASVCVKAHGNVVGFGVNT